MSEQSTPYEGGALLERLPPQNPEAEEAVLGSLLMDASAIAAVASILKPEDFYREKNATIYRTAISLSKQNRPVDFLTVSDELKRQDAYEEIGGLGYLSHLVGVVPTAVHIEHYADIVTRTATKRRLISAGTKIVQAAYDDSREVDDVLSFASEQIAGVSSTVDQGEMHDSQQRAELLFSLVEQLAQGLPPGVPTGFDVDFLTGGMREGALWMVGGYTGMGKSAWMQTVARGLAKSGRRVMYASSEMTDLELIKRDVAAHLRRDWLEIEADLLKPDEHPETVRKMGEFLAELAEWGLHVYNRGRMTTGDVRREVARLQMTAGDLDVVFVDYLQRLADPPARRNGERYQDVGEMARALKSMAMDLKVPVVCAAQLGRKVAERPGHVPQLSDFRESGDIECESDVVIGLNRPAAWPKTEGAQDPNPHEAAMYLLKNRGGQGTRTLRMVWLPERTEYANEARTEKVSPFRTKQPARGATEPIPF